MLGAPRGKFGMAACVTDLGIQCTHKVHRIIKRTAGFCDNLRFVGVENTVVTHECCVFLVSVIINHDWWYQMLSVKYSHSEFFIIHAVEISSHSFIAALDVDLISIHLSRGFFWDSWEVWKQRMCPMVGDGWWPGVRQRFYMCLWVFQSSFVVRMSVLWLHAFTFQHFIK